ncbi:hypothetical protein BaRGS_00016981 [Batillaria attramentaria]|uniref:Uncharacterized protein n=1 Tax=Batillaria attramentaria TaxID=370345 RepID=A0ABD0KY34_9CAEN
MEGDQMKYERDLMYRVEEYFFHEHHGAFRRLVKRTDEDGVREKNVALMENRFVGDFISSCVSMVTYVTLRETTPSVDVWYRSGVGFRLAEKMKRKHRERRRRWEAERRPETGEE